jgi:23S rRNA (cytosine1962-C5)-methyltransferase
MSKSRLQINKGEDRRLRAGHLWVFSNEVNVQQTPLTTFSPGDPVTVIGHTGEPLGSAYVNPHSLICARLISRTPGIALDRTLLRHRLQVALTTRDATASAPNYRIAFGESDGLPGLVVDRYGSVLVVQITTAGMERHRTDIIDTLIELLEPTGILLKNDAPVRTLEGLDNYVEVAHGSVPEQVTIAENGAQFVVPILEGQKTGWFFDQRLNRQRMQTYVRDKRVLDVFSYVGGWGIQAAVAGARAVTCIDASERALRLLQDNARRNDCAAKIIALQDDAFVALKQLHSAPGKFDLIVLDPPAFIKRKKDLDDGTVAYQRLNQMAMQLLAPGGILISASCSYHLPANGLLDILRRSALRQRLELQVLEQGHQAPDHPIHPAIPETNYLKAFICRSLA